MARRDTNSDTGKSTRNGSRESHMVDVPEPVRRAGSAAQDADRHGHLGKGK